MKHVYEKSVRHAYVGVHHCVYMSVSKAGENINTEKDLCSRIIAVKGRCSSTLKKMVTKSRQFFFKHMHEVSIDGTRNIRFSVWDPILVRVRIRTINMRHDTLVLTCIWSMYCCCRKIACSRYRLSFQDNFRGLTSYARSKNWRTQDGGQIATSLYLVDKKQA